MTSSHEKLVSVSLNGRGYFFVLNKVKDFKITTNINPLSPNSGLHQISPCNINAYSTHEVMRIKHMITQG